MSSLGHVAFMRLRCFALCSLQLCLFLLIFFPAHMTAQVKPAKPIVVPHSPPKFMPPPAKPPFQVKSYQGMKRCLDYGRPPGGLSAFPALSKGTSPSASVHPGLPGGTAVFLNDCGVSHSIVVEEIDASHHVILHAGSLVVGVIVPNNNPTGPVPPSGYSLALQTRVRMKPGFLSNQVFSLDGDSIIFASNRSLVAQVQNAAGAVGTAIVVAARNLADPEFWDFNATDGSHADPTTGFVAAGKVCDLLKYIPLNSDPYPAACPNAPVNPAGPGTVIKILPDNDGSFDFLGLSPLEIPAGVTIRGDRRGTLFGPLLITSKNILVPARTVVMLEPNGDDVRVTGLRLQGPSRSTDQNQPAAIGVRLQDGLTNHFFRSIIDHNDISDWTWNGVRAAGDDAGDLTTCDPKDNPLIRPINAVIARNFIHHNRMQDFGYGVESSFGGFPLVQGNTFVSNRHSIAAGYGTQHTGYRAWDNLVLSDAPLQKGLLGFIGDFHTQDFDMHGTDNNGGTLCESCNGFGGRGGDYVDIYENTFLGTNRPNYELRAEPCHHTDYHFNVSLESPLDALVFKDSNTQTGPRIEYINISVDPLQFYGPFEVNNQIVAGPIFSDPTKKLAVGDFDGDGNQDLFLATGAAWYYSPGGKGAWRYLNGGKTDKITNLLFGDFDGDGRTDVVGLNKNNLMVSWGGISDWVVLNTLPTGASFTDLAVGDFDGDGRSDLFYSNGQSWFVSYGGSGPFTIVNTSSFRVKDLRFGDFDGDKKTDVFGVVSNGVIKTWSYSKSATGSWADGFLQEALAPIDGLVVADFDGDGRADVAMSTHLVADGKDYGWEWAFSSGGAGNWTYRWPAAPSIPPSQWNTQLSAAPIGNFDGSPGADVLLWDGNEFDIVSGGMLQGASPYPRYSTQDMR